MTTNKPEVQRYDNMGSGQICRIKNMYESEDGDYVLYEDYEALKAECEKLRKDVSGLVEALEDIGASWHRAGTRREKYLQARARNALDARRKGGDQS